MNAFPLHRVVRGIRDSHQARIESLMSTNVGPAPWPQSPCFPPPPLLPFSLFICARIAPTDWAIDDDGMPVVAGRRSEKGEMIEACRSHIFGGAKDNCRRPEDRVQQSVRREERSGEGEVGDAQINTQDERDAADY